VGLFTGLLTLPLAPVRGTVWIAERLVEQAERELGDETAVRRRLEEVELRHELGEIGDEELAEAEDALLAQLAARREAAGGSDGA
jgi:Gas vesicle protein G